ncbi:uncharacterized protein LOC123638779, partial [Lemur catta]|uniref:uncharacterized protein LOC123638779 n=1 Tax=Lemur catta TaxID=9447 RepID=UPI001E26D778
EEEEERAEYTADIISTTVAEPYRTCFTAGGSKTSPVEQQPEQQQPQDIVSLPLPPPSPRNPRSIYTLQSIVQQIARVVHSSCRFVCHPCTTVSSTATTGKCITCQVPEQKVSVDISSCPKIFVGSPRDLVSLPFKVFLNSPGGLMCHHFILGHPKG